MKITEVAKIVSGPNPHHVDARKIYDTDNAIAVVITLQPGESLKKHMTPVDVFFYVLEGTGIVEISIQKLDTAGLPMTVELFNNGKMIGDKTIMTPKGTLAITVDLKTA